MSPQQKSSEVLLIIPAFNEASSIGDVLDKVAALPVKLDVLVINDCSDDDTAALAGQKGARVINLPFNMGYGAALQTGYKFALRHGYEYVIQMDGDGQHDAQSIPALLEEIKKQAVDLVIGTRFTAGQKNGTYPIPRLRRLGIGLFRAIASACTGQRITDPTSGFQALDKKLLNFFVSEVYPVDYPDADVLIMLARAGFKMKEVPVTMHRSADRKKSMHSGLKPVYYFFKMLLSIFVTLLRKDPPASGLPVGGA